MKKFLLYILIFTILVGLFGSAREVYATTCTNPPTNTIPDGCTPLPLGTCREGTAGQSFPNITEKDCNKKGEKFIWISYYYTLAPLPCVGDDTNGCRDGKLATYDPTNTDGGALGGYLNLMIKLFIGICAVLSVIMIVMGGIEYMTTELISSKEEGKKRITQAILGLLLALGAWTLLYTINPDLLNVAF